MARILLYQGSTTADTMFLNGTVAGDDFTVETLTVPGPTSANTFNLPPDVLVPIVWLQPSNADFIFTQAPSPAFELRFSMPLFSTTTNLDFLGAKFSGASGYAISLTVHITEQGLAMPDV